MFSAGRVLWSWFGAYLLALLAVMLQPTTPAQYLGRYSTTSFTILLVLLAGLLPAYLMIRWLIQHVPAWTLPAPLNRLALLLIGVALCAGWWVNTGPTASYLLIRLLLTYVLLSAAVWHVLQLPDSSVAVWILPGLCLIALIAVALLAQDVPGLLWTDEGFMASAARGVVETGRPQVTFLEPAVREAISLMYAGLAAWYELTGAGFSSGRLFILTVGVSSLLMVSVALRRLYRAGVVWLTLLVGVISSAQCELSATGCRRCRLAESGTADVCHRRSASAEKPFMVARADGAVSWPQPGRASGGVSFLCRIRAGVSHRSGVHLAARASN